MNENQLLDALRAAMDGPTGADGFTMAELVRVLSASPRNPRPVREAVRALLESGKAEDARADRDSADRLARIEERQRASQDSLVEIKQQLNLLLQRPLAPRTP